MLKRLYDGAGNFTATDIANRNGETGREAISGTYSVSPDCTFTEIEYTSDGTAYHSAGIPPKLPSHPVAALGPLEAQVLSQGCARVLALMKASPL